MAGPLAGVKVIEVAGLGPAPFCAMVLADMGADVVVVDRADAVTDAPPENSRGNVYLRGRRSVGVDLKHPDGAGVVARLVENADVFIESFRPGVAERLGIGPDVLCANNPSLIYGRMTGWGQEGPWRDRAGHDINYIALAGPLAHIGRAGELPTPPLNLLGDFGGGGLVLAFGIACALAERAMHGDGRGQVIDAAMVDGAALLSAPIAAAFALGFFQAERGTNWLDSGAPYYDVYRCADGREISIGAIEPKFYANLVVGLGLGDADADPVPDQHDKSSWPAFKERIAAVLATQTREHWLAVFDDPDNCVAPVLRFGEVLDDPHLAARGTYTEVGGVLQPNPAPRFSRTQPVLDRPPAAPGEHTDEVLRSAGVDRAELASLRASGAIA